MIIILMGVSGSGKTAIGKLLAERLHFPFVDADDFHSAMSKNKMSRGTALTDQDRLPWLKKLRGHLLFRFKKGQSCVLACSALKRKYRDILAFDKSEVRFVFLKGEIKLITERLKNRRGHYLHPALLPSQFKTLEEPFDALMVDIDKKEQAIVDDIVARLPVGWFA
ncbi:MAG: gluconokinase [Chitinivibrionales bacterium]|nr:gluconokinase [Chitinivibrionales bacterium]